MKVGDFGRMVFVPPQPSESDDGPAHLHEQFERDNPVLPPEVVRNGKVGNTVVAALDGCAMG